MSDDGYAQFKQLPKEKKTGAEKAATRIAMVALSGVLALVALTLILLCAYGVKWAFGLVTG